MKKKTIQENLVYQRKLKGYTQEELSNKTTVGVRTIQRIEKGDVQPHLQTIKLLAVGLDIEVEDLIVLDDPKEEPINRKWMLLLHGSPFLGFIIPFGNILFPLFFWIHKAEDNSIYDQHGKAIVNFHSTITLLFFASFLIFFIIPGFSFFITGALFLFGVITTVINIRTAIHDHRYKYPLSIKFIK